MSKPIDQEREAFEAWADKEWPGAKRQQLERDEQGWYKNTIYRDYWTGWQARASQQPAGVAVPDTYTLSDKAPFVIRDAQGQYVAELIAWDDELLTGLLAAAPHPVSGEQEEEPRPSWLDGGAEAVEMAKEDEANAVAGLVEALKEVRAFFKQMPVGMAGRVDIALSAYRTEKGERP